MNLPGLVLYGGTIAPGSYKGKDVTIQDVFEAVGANAAGKDELLWATEAYARLAALALVSAGVQYFHQELIRHRLLPLETDARRVFCDAASNYVRSSLAGIRFQSALVSADSV
jgi:hypothetical protein